MSEEPEKVEYNRALYAKSARERLRRINYSRVRRGSPVIASLEEMCPIRPVRDSKGRYAGNAR